MENLKDYYFNSLPSSDENIIEGINKFKDNIANHFINIFSAEENDFKYIVGAFKIFSEEIRLDDINTREDFEWQLEHFYDFIGECNHFSDKFEDDDKENNFDFFSIDGLMDVILHDYFNFRHLLPTQEDWDKKLNKSFTKNREKYLINTNHIINKFEQNYKSN